MLVYLEAYAHAERAALDILDTRDEVVWQDTISLAYSEALRSGVVSIPADGLPVGAFQIRATILPSGATASSPPTSSALPGD